MVAQSARTGRKIAAYAAIAAAAGALALVLLVLYLHQDLPKIRSMADYAPLQSSKLYSDDGHLVGQFFIERRTLVPFAAIPQPVVFAFLAAEDANFYAHEGIDYLGILRALIKNLRPGAHLQGASTITQQTVKTLVLGPERSYTRKIREALLARELEQVLSKEEILTLYLNQIYFGNGTYGVEEASNTYFGKSVRALDLGEAALLAAVPKNPARYNIRNDPVAAKARQKYVLEQMLARGWASAPEVTRAIEAQAPWPPPPPPYLGRAPYYVEQVRRQLVDTYGEDRLLRGGLTVYCGMHARAQDAATTALRQGLEDLARREGYTGAPLRLEVDRLTPVREALHDELAVQLRARKHYRGAPEPARGYLWDLSPLGAAMLGDVTQARRGVEVVPLAEYQRLRGLVVGFDRVKHEASIDLGTLLGRLSLKNMAWARRFSPRAASAAPRDPADVLQLGDIVTVEVAPGGIGRGPTPQVDVVLIPEPAVNGALVAIDPHSRLVRALVGGYRADGAGFNRATQALRQPGSAFKPVVYATALSENAITPAAICPDSPVVIADPWTGKPWKPENFEDGRYDGNITFRTALMRSKNTCSVRLLQKLGPDKVIAMAQAMGITAKLPNNLTLALGTGEVTPLELANAFATVAAGGLFAPPVFIRKVVDAGGQVLAEAHAEPTVAMSPQVAFVLTSMMRSVVDQGTARRALMLDRPLAGKTGTSQESRNVWFSGFSADLVGTVYMGFDNNEPLGNETGASAALPAWIRFIGAAEAGVAPQDFVAPEGVVTVRVNAQNGQVGDGPDSIDEVFVRGSEPTLTNQPLRSIFLEDDDKN